MVNGEHPTNEVRPSKTVSVLTAAKITELTTKFPKLGEDTFVHERDYNRAENGRVARDAELQRVYKLVDHWYEETKRLQHAFKNFHRLLCERFDYGHDEKDWQRDQLSLIEWIAKRGASETGAVQPIAWRRWIDSDYETKPRWIYTDQAPTVSPEKWEPLCASTAEKASGFAEDPENDRLKTLKGHK